MGKKNRLSCVPQCDRRKYVIVPLLCLNGVNKPDVVNEFKMYTKNKSIFDLNGCSKKKKNLGCNQSNVLYDLPDK